MHTAAYKALGMKNWRYQRLPVPPDLFAETVRGLPAGGFVGANVTIPHKEAALRLADKASQCATEIGAANTLIFHEEFIEADNTDAPGFIQALPFGITDCTALVLGAGGSARAVIWSLLNNGAKEVMVWNRTVQRAQAICRDIGGRVVTTAQQADLVVNCTAVGLENSGKTFDQLPLTSTELHNYRCVVDFVYRKGGTQMIAAAQAEGIQTVDGLEILAQQGALSFQLWTGKEPPLDVMRTALSKY